MAGIRIFADSTCDLPPSWIEEYNIGIIPLYVVFGEESLRDGIDITPEQLYARVDQNGNLPKTAAPSPSDFIAAFSPPSSKATIFCSSAFPPSSLPLTRMR